MNKWREILVMVVIITGIIAQASAGWQSAASEPPASNAQATGITEQRAIIIAQQHFKGRVLAINQTDHTYRIKILSNQGTVHMVLINALDGTVISTH